MLPLSGYWPTLAWGPPTWYASSGTPTVSVWLTAGCSACGFGLSSPPHAVAITSSATTALSLHLPFRICSPPVDASGVGVAEQARPDKDLRRSDGDDGGSGQGLQDD